MPSLSHSQIETWQACPLRWKLQQDNAPETPQPALLLGRAVHAAIEADNRLRLEGAEGMSSVSLQAAGRRALEEEQGKYDQDGVLQRHLPNLAQKAEAMLAAYHRQIAGRFPPVLVEQPFRVAIPGCPDRTFTGRIDALVTDEQGARVIVDYKTAKRRWRVGEERGKLQATAYLWAVEQQPDWGEVQGVIFIPLSASLAGSGYAAWAEPRFTAQGPADRLSYTHLLGQVMTEMADSAAAGAYLAKPGWQCTWCAVAAASAAPSARATSTPTASTTRALSRKRAKGEARGRVESTHPAQRPCGESPRS